MQWIVYKHLYFIHHSDAFWQHVAIIKEYAVHNNSVTMCPDDSNMMEKISWTDHVRNEEVLLRVSEQRNILHEIRKRKAN
jgi:hypothetical protein